MKNKTLLISTIIFMFLNISGLAYSAEIAGNAHYFSSNGNSKDSIEAEVRRVDLMAAIGEKSISVRNVKLKLSGDAWVFFELEFEVSPGDISGRQRDIVECYVRLRLNGLSTFGSVQIMKCWFDPKTGKYPKNYDNFPKERFEKIDKVPDWAISFFNEGFPSTKEKDEYYMFRDHDLVWLMRAQGDNCHFVCGFDGRHFSQKGFQSAFLRERKTINDDRISKAQAVRIGARLMESWCVRWHSPFEIPLPGDAGSGHE